VTWTEDLQVGLGFFDADHEAFVNRLRAGGAC
jgi:hemerythrin